MKHTFFLLGRKIQIMTGTLVDNYFEYRNSYRRQFKFQLIEFYVWRWFVSIRVYDK